MGGGFFVVVGVLLFFIFFIIGGWNGGFIVVLLWLLFIWKVIIGEEKYFGIKNYNVCVKIDNVILVFNFYVLYCYI